MKILREINSKFIGNFDFSRDKENIQD